MDDIRLETETTRTGDWGVWSKRVTPKRKVSVVPCYRRTWDSKYVLPWCEQIPHRGCE